MKAIKLCADDFGLSRPVNAAIISLVGQQRLNAVSCMSVGDSFAAAAEELRRAVSDTGEDVEIGLHVTLTEYGALSGAAALEGNGTMPGIGALMMKSFAGRMDVGAVETEIRMQYDRFEAVLGRKPDFVDGHQHVHLLPGVRETFVSVARERLPAQAWVRSCVRPAMAIVETGVALPRTLLIAQLGRPLKKALEPAGIAANDCFFGVNDFRTEQDYGGLMRRWLAGAAKCAGVPLIMCHPGLKPDANSGVRDPIAARRFDEFTYLSSPDFAADLAAHRLSLKRA